MREFEAVSEQEWRARVERELGGEAPETLTSETLEGVPVSPLYTAVPAGHGALVGESISRRSSASPGATWTACQRFDDPDLEVVSEQVRADLLGGVEGLWLKLDRGTRLGLDLDSEQGARAAGRDGLLLLDATDLAELLAQLGGRTPEIWVDAGGNGFASGVALLAALETAGLETSALRLRFGIDPLAALVADGEIPAGADRLVAEAVGLADCVANRATGFSLLTVSTLPYADAGADAVQQLAFMTATTVQYLRWLEAAGMAPERALAQLDLVVGMGRDFLFGVAMLRAARALISRVAAACDVHSGTPSVHAVTGGRTLTRADPWTNMLRVTTQTAAAIIGGADVITTAPFDGRLGRSDALGRRAARNTQAILREESGLGRTVDPAGGSYAIESLSRELAQRAWDLFRKIERRGGMDECVSEGWAQDRVLETSHRRAVRLREQHDVLLGVSHFEDAAGEAPAREHPDRKAVVRAARGRRREHLGRRADPLVEALRAAGYARDEEPAGSVVEAAVGAARAGATIAELSDALHYAESSARAPRLRAFADEDLWGSDEEVPE